MKKMTEKSLNEAFAGESQAHMRYLNFSRVAAEEGFKNVSRLFEAIAYAEQAHASNHFKALGNPGKTVDNLQAAMNGENFEVQEMYPAYNAIAQLQGEKDAIRTIHFALEAEKIHSKMYTDAKKSVSEGKDIASDDIYICSVCGYTTTGEAPDRCPICGAPIEKFKKF